MITADTATQSGLTVGRGSVGVNAGQTFKSVDAVTISTPVCVVKTAQYATFRNVDAKTAQFLNGCIGAYDATIHTVGRKTVNVTGPDTLDIVDGSGVPMISGPSVNAERVTVEYRATDATRIPLAPKTLYTYETGPDGVTPKHRAESLTWSKDVTLARPAYVSPLLVKESATIGAAYIALAADTARTGYELSIGAELPTPEQRRERSALVNALHAHRDAYHAATLKHRDALRALRTVRRSLNFDARTSNGIAVLNAVDGIVRDRDAHRAAYTACVDALVTRDALGDASLVAEFERYESLKSESERERSLAAECNALAADCVRTSGAIALHTVTVLQEQAATHKARATDCATESRRALRRVQRAITRAVAPTTDKGLQARAKEASRKQAERASFKAVADTEALQAQKVSSACRVERKRLLTLLTNTLTGNVSDGVRIVCAAALKAVNASGVTDNAENLLTLKTHARTVRDTVKADKAERAATVAGELRAQRAAQRAAERMTHAVAATSDGTKI